MVDKFWNFFSWERGAMARARSDAPSRPDRPPGAAALALEAERGPCDVRSRASRASTRSRRVARVPRRVWRRCVGHVLALSG